MSEIPDCILRPACVEDLERWLAWINDSDVMEGLDRVERVDYATHVKFIQRFSEQEPTAQFFVIEIAGDAVGIIWLWEIHKRHRRAEVRLFIGESHMRSVGIGSTAIRKLAHLAFSNLGLHKLYAYVHRANVASRKAFEKAGFTVEVLLMEEAYRNGAFDHVYRMALISQ